MTETYEKIEDIEIRLLLEALYHRYHYDFRNYAMSSIRRRLRQAREQLGFATISAMQERVLHDPDMLPRMLRYLTVQVSEMFRDPSYFRAIREKVVPHLRTYPSLKIWIAGCSTGEELYSFVILFREEGLEERTLFYATDINPEALAQAEAGVYELDRLRLFT
jgi:chemotaxis protein methyltransferase CheR